MGTHKAPLYRSKTSARYVPRRDKCVADYGYDLLSVVVREKGATCTINASFPRETRSRDTRGLKRGCEACQPVRSALSIKQRFVTMESWQRRNASLINRHRVSHILL